MMPGGDVEAWKTLQPILEAVAAKVGDDPCVAYMGKDAAGHYVKMVHNGIEYAIMQLISEVYDLLKRGMSYDNKQLAALFSKWNQGPLQSFLLEITETVFQRIDDETGNYLVDMILDKAGSKGTGKWTSQDAMELPVSVPTIDIAVAMRDLSVEKDDRVKAGALYRALPKPIRTDSSKFESQLENALHAATIICYAQGLAMLQKASGELKMDIPIQDVVKIWRGGCIIRSASLELFAAAIRKNKSIDNILLDKKIATLIKKKIVSLRKVIPQAISSKIPVAGLMSALGYFDAFCSDKLPVNLIQAQRDFFGAHTYQRTDKEGTFHTEWETNTKA
jgi:6-phosphogluconate dehydrogenase